MTSGNLVFRWVYKVFRRFENALRKPSLGNAFWLFWGPISQKNGPNVFIFDRIYKGVRNAFLHFEKPCFHWFYKVSRRSENALRKPSLCNAFDHFECNFRKRGPKVFIFDRFYKVLSMVNSPCAFYLQDSCKGCSHKYDASAKASHGCTISLQ